ncbi:hypothetical protein C9374_008700 [Naegleria lovaniensis]|uniref:tRNA dimethylallyltransferase n=1 Tax=Naegleria lovaniensis TaxID=51637 RepID=A0AA88GGG1_NAELO|nr:uncharacterized protein C9374_008700 [Naegleria lovaniensis]KAG2378078.1 hypothetical protein C9374_008700 [Naegleria lovaniensis]
MLQNHNSDSMLLQDDREMKQKGKVIVCAGSTGVGKSALALHLARMINSNNDHENMKFKSASIINADVMQIYEGLPITTNKPSESELQEIEHHFVGEKQGVVSDRAQLYTVLNYKKDCHELFEQDLFKRDVVPIICGGTNYYIQSVIFDQYLIGTAEESNGLEYNETKKDEDSEDLKKYTHERLKEIDPESAALIHPNDIRKIKKRILLYEKEQRVFTQVIDSKKEEQRTLKYETLFFYLACDNRGVLRQRIADRAVQMMENGLLQEVVTFHEYLFKNKDKLSISFEHGVLQSIGYKEFLPYLKYLEEINDIGDKNEEDAILKKKNELKQQCLESLINGTFKYAKKQETWYRSSWANSKLPLVKQGILYKFDISTTPVDVIKESALQIAKHFLEGKEIPQDLVEAYQVKEPHQKSSDQQGDENKTYWCEKCNSTHHGYTEYRAHLKSRLHKKRKNKSVTPVVNERNREDISESKIPKGSSSENEFLTTTTTADIIETSSDQEISSNHSFQESPKPNVIEKEVNQE